MRDVGRDARGRLPRRCQIGARLRKLEVQGPELHGNGLRGIHQQVCSHFGELEVHPFIEQGESPEIVRFVKDETTLWVKPSGTTLGGLTPETFVALDRAKINELYAIETPAEPHARVRMQCSPYHTDSAFWPVIEHLRHAAGFTADDQLSAQLDKLEALVAAAQAAIKAVTGRDTELSTAGGTSDGRFIAPTGAQVLELGAINATIHQVDERTPVADLDRLKTVYRRVLEYLLGG